MAFSSQLSICVTLLNVIRIYLQVKSFRISQGGHLGDGLRRGINQNY